MKRLIFFMCCFYVSIGFAKPKTDLQVAGLKGRVKSVTEVTYSNMEMHFKGGCVAADDFYYTRHQTDNKGNQVVRFYYDYKGNLLHTKTDSFDSLNNLIAERLYFQSGLDYEMWYHYNVEGYPVEKVVLIPKEVKPTKIDLTPKFFINKTISYFDTYGFIKEKGRSSNLVCVYLKNDTQGAIASVPTNAI